MAKSVESQQPARLAQKRGEVDLHAAHWNGQTVLNHGRRRDVIKLLRLSMSSVDMLADNQAVALPCDRSYRGGHEHPVLYSVLDALLK